MQSHEQITSIWTDWKTYHSPKNLKDTEKTMELLADYVAKNYQGIVSRASLDAAVAALGANVLVPEPSAQEKAVANAAKLEAHMRQDYADSKSDKSIAGTQKRNQQKANEDNKAAAEKAYKTVVNQIENEISNYTIGHVSGSMDYGKTEYGRDKLRKVRDSHDRRTIAGAKSALSAVQVAKSKL
jgi:hypothetical protein